MTNPLGVSLTAATGRYRAEYKGKYLGRHDTSDEAEEKVLEVEIHHLYKRLNEAKSRLIKLHISNKSDNTNKALAKDD